MRGCGIVAGRVVAVAWVVLLALTPLRAAGQTAGDIGVDERLGRKVAVDVVLKDEDGRDVVLGQLLDKPTILTLNYFSCAGICTPLLNDVLAAVNAINDQPGKDFQVVTVSFDPRDTPEIAARKRVNYLKLMHRPFPPTAWRFLTGEATATRRLADSVGFGYKEQDGGFIHPGVIMFLAPDGTVTRYMYGTHFLPADVEMAIAEASRGQVRPTVSQFLAFCYSYDPAGRRYVFRMTRVVGVALIALVAGYVAYLALTGRRKEGKTA